MPGHPLATMMRLDPAFMDHLKAADDLVYADGALPRRIKLLVAMAFDAAHGAEGGVKSLAQSAMKAGATKEEITEVMRVACHLGGVGAVYTASKALEELFP
jgi:alkylhydroperoxidase/carboxymuconolactone decarboxylase family protein YurZ